MAHGDLVFVDIETTGLSYQLHNVIEIAYMTNTMTEPVVVIPYDYHPNFTGESTIFDNADPEAMKINKFYERYPDGIWYSGDQAVKDMIDVMQGSTLVGANVRFDARFLETDVIGSEVWHHRLFDLQAYAAGVFGDPFPLGWKGICDRILSVEKKWGGFKGDPGFAILPDHSAAADTLSVKQAYHWLYAWSHSDDREEM